MQKCDLTAIVYLEDDDIKKLEEAEIESKIKGIDLILQRKLNKSQNNLENDKGGSWKFNINIIIVFFLKINLANASRYENFGKSRPVSNYIRPKSAFSVFSHHSLQKRGKKNNQIDEEKNSKFVCVGKTDKDGTIVFKDIPYGVYSVEMAASHDFLPEKTRLNLFLRFLWFIN